MKLLLFVTGRSTHSMRAIQVIRDVVESRSHEGCEVDVIDVLEAPERATELQVLATPALIRVAPGPERRLIGDLGDPARIIEALQSFESA